MSVNRHYQFENSMFRVTSSKWRAIVTRIDKRRRYVASERTERFSPGKWIGKRGGTLHFNIVERLASLSWYRRVTYDSITMLFVQLARLFCAVCGGTLSDRNLVSNFSGLLVSRAPIKKKPGSLLAINPIRTKIHSNNLGDKKLYLIMFVARMTDFVERAFSTM